MRRPWRRSAPSPPSGEDAMTYKLLDIDGYRRALSVRDLTDAAAGPHAMQLITERAIAALRDRWGCPVIVYRDSPIVAVEDNYDRLRYPSDAAARDARYTRYVTATTVLRTHTTAMIPGLLRAIAHASYADVLLACPGLVYRRDTIDRLHSGEPHQLDLWRVRAGSLDEEALDDMIRRVVAATLPGGEVRWSPALHPYTKHGRQIDAR